MFNFRSRASSATDKEFERVINPPKGESRAILMQAYSRWYHMMRRCYNKRDQAYKNYGGRGIKVVRRWHAFALYFLDTGEPPFENATIDRTDNDGHYGPHNWRWATAAQQNANKRTSEPIVNTEDGPRINTKAKGSILNLNGRWRALVRIRKWSACATFDTEGEARAWAAEKIEEICKNAARGLDS